MDDEPPQSTTREYRSRGEFAQALKGLGELDRARLKRASVSMAGISQTEWDDILQEAYERVWAGRRPWPTTVKLLPFLSGVMRSITDQWRTKRQLRLTAASQAVVINQNGTVRLHLTPAGNTPEDAIIEIEEALAERARFAEMRQELIGLFTADDVALLILEGMLKGLEGEYLRELTTLDKTAFATKQKKILRRIRKFQAVRLMQ